MVGDGNENAREDGKQNILCSFCVDRLGAHTIQVHTLREREREMFYLMTHSTHFIYGYMASDIWLRTILIVRKETCCRHIGYSFRLAARVLLYAPSHRQDNTYHGLCYTSRGALAGTRNSPTLKSARKQLIETFQHYSLNKILKRQYVVQNKIMQTITVKQVFLRSGGVKPYFLHYAVA